MKHILAIIILLICTALLAGCTFNEAVGQYAAAYAETDPDDELLDEPIQSIHTDAVPSTTPSSIIIYVKTPHPTSIPTSTPAPSPTPEPTLTPSPEPTPQPTPIPTLDPEKAADLAARWPYVALTFDDGPHKKQTLRLLDILDAYGVKATFFVQGQRAIEMPEIIKRMYDDGHIIGNHTYSHANLTKLVEDDIISQIELTDDVIFNITGEKPFALRPPLGAVNDALLDLMAQRGPIVKWTVDPEDWKDRDTQIVVDRVIANVKPGSIILMHDVYETSVDAAELIIQRLQEEGYGFVTVPEMLGEMEPGTVYKREGKKPRVKE